MITECHRKKFTIYAKSAAVNDSTEYVFGPFFFGYCAASDLQRQ